MYMYTFDFLYICIYVYVCVYVYIYMHTDMYTYMLGYNDADHAPHICRSIVKRMPPGTSAENN